ncbi:XRE family transcriptional regulator [Rhodococcus sp. NPDC003322]
MNSDETISPELQQRIDRATLNAEREYEQGPADEITAVKYELLYAIDRKIDEEGWTEERCRTYMELPEARLSDLRYMRTARFTVEDLIEIAFRIDVRLEIAATHPPKRLREHPRDMFLKVEPGEDGWAVQVPEIGWTGRVDDKSEARSAALTAIREITGLESVRLWERAPRTTTEQ